MVEVDSGMFELLTELKRIGVKTEYSCEGDVDDDDDEAYLVVKGRNALKFVRLLRRQPMFRKCSFVFEVAGFEKDEDPCIHQRFIWLLAIGPRWACHSIEVRYSRMYGLRYIVRWPGRMNDAVLDAVKSTRRL
jgi:hypothetical protein